MTEEVQQEVSQEATPVDAQQSIQIDIGRIVYSILKEQNQVSVPAEYVLNAVPENTEIEIKYDGEAQKFMFSIKGKLEDAANN